MSRFVIALILVLIPCINAATTYCCLKPNFGSNWCHSSSCLGAGCRNIPDPITKQSQSNYLCDDLSNCICGGMVSTYSSMSFCTVKKSCANAKNGFAQATEMATAALQGTPNTQCLDAITTALCAYHFPRCEDDEKRFPAVCYDTCQTLKLQCKLQLDDIVLIQGRCQGPPTEDNKATQDKCTAAAPHIGLGFFIALLPFFFVSIIS